MWGRSASEVLSLPVRLHGIQLGRPVEALLDPASDRLLGFEIVCGDGARRFLPFAVARLGTDEIALDSALALIDERDVGYYRRRSRTLAEAGYEDPWIDDDGGVHEALSAA
ncbi:MAG: hypothetical protein HOQ28_09920 [Thermoleophilia bacterium]|nr:hypothetical protein [Thermoleophilia bacterium]